MVNLPEPSPELAARTLREVGYEQRLAGFKLNAMAGSVPQDLYSLRNVADFLHVDPLDVLLGPGGNGRVNYIDLGVLARWVAEIIGDPDLATALRETTSPEEPYARQVGPVAEVLEERLRQCGAVLEKTAKPETGPEGAPAEA